MGKRTSGRLGQINAEVEMLEKGEKSALATGITTVRMQRTWPN